MTSGKKLDDGRGREIVEPGTFNLKPPSKGMAMLRQLHVEMDQAVVIAYGWQDLDLCHGFHETKQGIRFTISEAARREVLDRLLALNHQRHAEEVAAAATQAPATPAKRGRKKKDTSGQSLGLFD